jgi:ribonuclease HI
MTALVEMKITTRTAGDLGAWQATATAGDSRQALHGEDAMTTANRVELTAALQGLGILRRRCAVEIYTDSAYLAQGAAALIPVWDTDRDKASAFRASLRNVQLWDQLIAVASRHDIHWHWAKPVGSAKKITRLSSATNVCKKCGGEVVWIREEGKHVAVDVTGSLHALSCKRIAAARGDVRSEIWGRTPGKIAVNGASAVYDSAVAPWDESLGEYREFTPDELALAVACDHIAADGCTYYSRRPAARKRNADLD